MSEDFSDIYLYKAKVLRVIDGDTVDVQVSLGFNIYINERLRLFGIDAPETRTRDSVEKSAGIASKEWLFNRIHGKEIKIRTHDKGTEKYGRWLVQIYIGPDNQLVNVNKEMVDLGLAKPYMTD